jgi:hypothetical protein
VEGGGEREREREGVCVCQFGASNQQQQQNHHAICQTQDVTYGRVTRSVICRRFRYLLEANITA